MQENLLWTAFLILLGLVLVRYRAVFWRFDAKNRARIEAERRDRADHLAHFRHTLRLAEEQVEEVGAVTVPDERTGMPIVRYLFEGESFANEDDARRVREDKLRAIARGFYMELPAALRARKDEDKLRAN